MNNWLKAAAWLGIVPLVSGIGVFIAWVLSGADWLMEAGIITIDGGVAAVALGFVCLCVYLWKQSAVPWGRRAWRAAAVLGLYLVNVVAAGGAVYGATLILSLYTVSIANHSPIALESARIEGGGLNVDVGTIRPGDSAKRRFWIKQEGELTLVGMHGTKPIRSTIDGYASGIGGNTAVAIQPDGTVTVIDRRQHAP